MALEKDEVQYTELLDAFHKLYNDLKNEKIKNKVLSKKMKNFLKKIHVMFLKFLLQILKKMI